MVILKRHRRIKHRISCQYCHQKKFVNEIHNHEQTHFIKCKYCQVLQKPDQLEQHQNTHLIKCNYCAGVILKESLEAHVKEKHSTFAEIGMLAREVTDDRFNQLIREGRIYARCGRIFVKQ